MDREFEVSEGFSDGRASWRPSLTLDNIVGTDLVGYVGLEDDVDYHWRRIVAGAMLTTLLGVGAELAAPHAQTYGETVDAATLIPHMLEAFLAGDRGFRKGSAGKAASSKPS